MIYFDHAATSWPKPQQVEQAMLEAVRDYGANPGRGGHRLSRQAATVVHQTRERLARFFSVSDPKRVLFFASATAALNQAIKGLDWQAGDHVLSTTYEHNAVYRPLAFLARTYGVNVEYIEIDEAGEVDVETIKRRVRPETKMMVCTHASNVTGHVFPIEKIGPFMRDAGVRFVVDGAQSAGLLPINMNEIGIDMLAIPGHKALYGPQGIGALILGPEVELQPIIHGGTGTHSELDDQPDVLPQRFEAGTLNTPGIAGLGAGVAYVEEHGREIIAAHDSELTRYIGLRLTAMDGVHVYGPDFNQPRTPVIAFNINGIHAHEVAIILDEHYDIATRAGLHCSPLGHRSLQTEAEGVVRISFGYTNTSEEADVFLDAVETIRQAFVPPA